MHFSEKFTAFQEAIGCHYCDRVIINIRSKIQFLMIIVVHDSFDFGGDYVVFSKEWPGEKLPRKDAAFVDWCELITLRSHQRNLVFTPNMRQLFLINILVFHHQFFLKILVFLSEIADVLSGNNGI